MPLYMLLTLLQTKYSRLPPRKVSSRLFILINGLKNIWKIGFQDNLDTLS